MTKKKPPAKKRHEVTVNVEGVGTLAHMIRCDDENEAMERLIRAYPNRNVTIVKFRNPRKIEDVENELA